jgi:hypothetical protein
MSITTSVGPHGGVMASAYARWMATSDSSSVFGVASHLVKLRTMPAMSLALCAAMKPRSRPAMSSAGVLS